MTLASPFNLLRWIDENRTLLRPPIGNKLLFHDSEFIVMAVGGPNSRKDFHHDPAEELFYQLEGDIILRVIDAGKIIDLPIRAGDLFLLPPEVPHSPQRPADSIGIVIERRRRGGELDGFSWYCERCGHRLYLERVAVSNIETELPAIFARFYSSSAYRTCDRCGEIMAQPS